MNLITLRVYLAALVVFPLLVSMDALAGPPASTPALVEQGKAAYKIHCIACHGEKLDGNGVAGQYMNPKPRNLTADKFKAGSGAQEIFNTTSKGLPGTTMAAFGHVSEQDRWGIVHYILSLRKK
ncbi:MAG: cytochrome c [Bdellovibrionales bacterium]|nr:cytochrome c [Bdellovibrionales bacterium]